MKTLAAILIFLAAEAAYSQGTYIDIGPTPRGRTYYSWELPYSGSSYYRNPYDGYQSVYPSPWQQGWTPYGYGYSQMEVYEYRPRRCSCWHCQRRGW